MVHFIDSHLYRTFMSMVPPQYQEDYEELARPPFPVDGNTLNGNAMAVPAFGNTTFDGNFVAGPSFDGNAFNGSFVAVPTFDSNTFQGNVVAAPAFDGNAFQSNGVTASAFGGSDFFPAPTFGSNDLAGCGFNFEDFVDVTGSQLTFGPSAGGVMEQEPFQADPPSDNSHILSDPASPLPPPANMYAHSGQLSPAHSDYHSASSPPDSGHTGLSVLADAAACNGSGKGTKSHVLAPQPTRRISITPNATPRGSIVSASSPSSVGGPSTPGAGPTSKVHEIPPRPKPGRKPATDVPGSKRKAQNRESQRAFRARKVAKLEEVETELRASNERHQAELEHLSSNARHLSHRLEVETNRGDRLQMHANEMEDQLAKMKADRDFWRAQAERVESDRQALKANNADLTVQLMRANESMSVTSPPEMASAAPGQEFDFTPEFCPSAALRDESMADRNCGFCDKSSGKSSCPCDDAAAAAAAAARKSSV